MNIRKTLFVLTLVMFLYGSMAVHAAVIEGVRFDDTVTIQQTQLFLKGTGLSRYLVVLKGYVGAFYLPKGIESRQALDNVPKRLVLEYFHAIKAKGFSNATKRMIEKNVTPVDLKRLSPKIDQLVEAYRDVEPGDRYTLTYIPGYGTRLSLNGESLIVIAGEDFAKAVFSIWVGPSPIDEWFRSGVLAIDK
jgi:hypothetical protein